MSWKKLKSTVKYQNRYMTVAEEELVTDHGDHVTYGIVHSDPGVWVVPWDGEKFLIVGQYRYPIDFFSWEVLAGHAEDKDLSVAAADELEEEAGLKAAKLVEIGNFFLAPGHHTQKCHVFVAEGFSQGEMHREPAEKGMQTKWVTPKDMNQLIADGTVKDGTAISAFKLFELYLKNQ